MREVSASPISRALTWINAGPHDAVNCDVMPDSDDNQPGDKAPRTGHYEERNVSGSLIGEDCPIGEKAKPLPSAPREVHVALSTARRLSLLPDHPPVDQGASREWGDYAGVDWSLAPGWHMAETGCPDPEPERPHCRPCSEPEARKIRHLVGEISGILLRLFIRPERREVAVPSRDRSFRCAGRHGVRLGIVDGAEPPLRLSRSRRREATYGHRL